MGLERLMGFKSARFLATLVSLGTLRLLGTHGSLKAQLFLRVSKGPWVLITQLSLGMPGFLGLMYL